MYRLSHDAGCNCADCEPLDHTTRENKHELYCFCDLCAEDAHISTIGFTSCTCDQCDPEGNGSHCLNTKRDQEMHESIIAKCKAKHSDDYACILCNHLSQGEITYIHGDDGHWIECQCMLCCATVNVSHCTCPKCNITPDIPDPIAITRVETKNTIIEIHKEQYGYSTSSISKIDGFSGETTFSIDLKEAEEELERYKTEVITYAIPPPELQKKLDLVEYESEDEGDMSDIEDTIVEMRDIKGYRITNIHHGHHLYTVNVYRLSDMQEIESHYLDSPGTATLVVKDCVKKYQ